MKHISEILFHALQQFEPRGRIDIGIDIGVTGALSAIDEQGEAVVHDLPILEFDGGRRINAPELVMLLSRLVAGRRGAVAAIEDVRVRTMASHPMAHSTENSLAQSRGIVQACLDIVRVQTKAVEPMTWKRFYGLIGSSKDDALVMARKLYPDVADQLARKKDHNRAESLLIAHYCNRVLA